MSSATQTIIYAGYTQFVRFGVSLSTQIVQFLQSTLNLIMAPAKALFLNQ